MIGTQRVRARWGQPMACSGAMRRLVCCLALFAACEKSTPATESSTPPAADAADPLAGKPVVRNVEAKTGDGRKVTVQGGNVVAEDPSRPGAKVEVNGNTVNAGGVKIENGKVTVPGVGTVPAH